MYGRREAFLEAFHELPDFLKFHHKDHNFFRSYRELHSPQCNLSVRQARLFFSISRSMPTANAEDPFRSEGI